MAGHRQEARPAWMGGSRLGPRACLPGGFWGREGGGEGENQMQGTPCVLCGLALPGQSRLWWCERVCVAVAPGTSSALSSSSRALTHGLAPFAALPRRGWQLADAAGPRRLRRGRALRVHLRRAAAGQHGELLPAFHRSADWRGLRRDGGPGRAAVQGVAVRWRGCHPARRASVLPGTPGAFCVLPGPFCEPAVLPYGEQGLGSEAGTAGSRASPAGRLTVATCPLPCHAGSVPSFDGASPGSSTDSGGLTAAPRRRRLAQMSRRFRLAIMDIFQTART